MRAIRCSDQSLRSYNSQGKIVLQDQVLPMVQILIPQDAPICTHSDGKASGPNAKQIQKQFLKHQSELVTHPWPLQSSKLNINPLWVYFPIVTGKAGGFPSDRMMQSTSKTKSAQKTKEEEEEGRKKCAPLSVQMLDSSYTFKHFLCLVHAVCFWAVFSVLQMRLRYVYVRHNILWCPQLVLLCCCKQSWHPF